MMEPVTRVEKFLAKIAGREIEVPRPITRLEMFLQAILDKGGTGGGGELPSVTTSDNGKFLRVSDGVWVAESIPNAEEASF